MLVRFDHVARFIIIAAHSIMGAAAKLRDVPALLAEFQGIGDDVERFNAFLSRVASKKEREHRHSSARAPLCLFYELSSPEGSPDSLIATQAINGRTEIHSIPRWRKKAETVRTLL